METHASFWHYILAPFVLAAVGVLWHMARGLWAPYPERLTGNNVVDLYLPTGYSLTDIIHEVEFDEDGYYELYSWRNLKIAVGLTLFPGMFLLIFSTDVADAFALCANAALSFLADLVVYRWENLW